MLLQLSINNYAIIDHLNLKPDGHLNIVTGETGAGKSIILGALSLILGDRVDTSVLINKENKCIIEATFDISENIEFKNALNAAELDEDNLCIIRREISVAGKSRAFVNDTPVNLSVLNTLTALLVDLHQQFDNREIEESKFQLLVVDVLAENDLLKNEYQNFYNQYLQTTQTLIAKKEEQSNWQKEADYKQFLFDELEQMSFKSNEIEEAEHQLKQLNSSENIINILQHARLVLDENENPIANEIKRLAQQLQSIAHLLPQAESLYERLQSMYAEAKDIANELEHLESKVSINPEQMLLLQDRVDAGIKLLKKHGVNSTDELIEIHQKLSEELQATLNLHEEIATLEKQKDALFNSLKVSGKALTTSRKKIAPKLAEKVSKLLAEVGMPNAQFLIEISELAKPNPTGLDNLEFLLDANKSGQLLPIYKAASGGEMSRISLCIKSIIARAMHLPTLIFDEVDTGISGEVARKVAALLKDLSQHHQIICITHQAQVAAKGTSHFYVYKEPDNKGKIATKVKSLSPEERILSIAKMIGGEQPSEAAINNARELTEA